jgi:GTPase SAR1 family protein
LNIAPNVVHQSIKTSSQLFTGQRGYLDNLKQHFSPDQPKTRKSFLLYGMGGAGKTQICLRFIEEISDW